MTKCPQRLLRGSKVEELLQVSRRALIEWSATGFLPVAGYVMSERHYHTDILDALLEEYACNFKVPPTTESLLAGKVRLVPTTQAVQIANVSDRHLLSRRVARGHLAAVKLPGTWLYCRQTLQDFMSRRLPNRTEVLSRRQVGHVLGVGKTAILELLSSGKLAAVDAPEFGKQRPVTRSSLLGLLAELLPAWIAPETWLEDRLDSTAALLTEVQVVRMLQAGNARGLRRHLEEHALLYVSQPKGMGKRFLPESVWGILEREPRITHAQLAGMFGVSEAAIAGRVRTGRLSCPIPEHPHQRKGQFYRPCARAMARQLSPAAFSEAA